MSNSTMRFSVENMKCAGCVSAVEEAVKSLEGINNVEVNLDEQLALVEASVNADEIVKVISDAGFPAKLI